MASHRATGRPLPEQLAHFQEQQLQQVRAWCPVVEACYERHRRQTRHRSLLDYATDCERYAGTSQGCEVVKEMVEKPVVVVGGGK